MNKKIIAFLLIAHVIAGTSGKIRGTVLDSSTSKPIPGCTLYLENITNGAIADKNGEYIIMNVPSGEYNLYARMIGYNDLIIENIQVNLDLTTFVDILLKEQTLESKPVIVKATPKLINKNLTATTAIVTDKMISKLPINEVSEILNLQAGFVDGHLRGGRSSEIAYWVDGMPITDGYDGSSIIDVNKDAIKEMQLISGAFNAEYGQAMSGVVNISTSDGTNKFGGSFDAYIGDFISRHSDVFMNISNVDLLSTNNLNLNFRGSIIEDKLFYYISTRKVFYQGVYEGQNIYQPFSYGYKLEDENTGSNYWHVLGTNAHQDSIVNNIECGGPANCLDNLEGFYNDLRNAHASNYQSSKHDYKSMDWNLKQYFQLNLIWKPDQYTKFKISNFIDDVDFQQYNRYYKLNPDGDLIRQRIGKTITFKLNKVINPTSYFNFGIIQFNKEYEHYVHEDLEEYVHSDLSVQNTPSYSFSTGGMDQNRFKRKTKSDIFKFEYMNQISTRHQIKLGFEYKKHSIFYEDVNLQYYVDNGFNPIYDSPFVAPQISDISSTNTSIYSFEPDDASIYIQDKIEFDEIIINAGLRYDYFNPNGRVLSDPTDPFIYDPIRPEHIYDCSIDDGYCGDNEPLQSLQDRLEYWYLPTTAKSMISPRIGASFPISDVGVFHFSYGHFFQTPKFELLYYNADIALDRGGTGNIGVIGNPDLKPEKTISYELGVQYKLDYLSAIDVTVYFRDIRDLTGTRSEVIFTHNGATYYKYENSDFAFVKGLVLSYKKDFSNGFNTSLDYTFQQAKGTASNPFDAYNATIANSYPEIYLIPLNWDQRHTLNATLYYDTNDWGVGFIAKFGSGQPYTPNINMNFSNLIVNSGYKPNIWNLDMRTYFNIRSLPYNAKIYFNVFNIFDHLNQVNVYDDTGVADRTLYEQEALTQNTDQIINTIDEWFNNETFYSQPRRIEIGFRYEF